MKFLAALLLLTSPLALGGCHSCEGQIRFWQARDARSGVTGFTTDTVDAPLGQRIPAEYLNAAGNKVVIEEPVISPITEAQFTAGTNGAGYSLSYCPVMKACWSLPRAK